MDFDTRCINAIRFLSVDMIEKANSGHPGMPMGAAPMAYVLWTKFLKFNPKDPYWADRDRFVLSAGHGSALLYSLLYLSGYDLSLDDIKQFRQWGSKTPGHPEYRRTPGVECTTGPLGQGFANAIGMAMGEAFLAARFNRTGHEIMDHYTYSIVSDGDIMEGVASEAASLAGHLKLGKVVYLYDSNHITLSAATSLVMTENVGKRFEAYGWHYQYVEDGNDLAAIEEAIKKAREETGRPSLIEVRTHIGYGSPKQDSFEAHGSPLGPEDTRKAKENLGWPTEPPFYVPDEVLSFFRQSGDRGAKLESGWDNKLSEYAKAYPDMRREWDRMMKLEFPPDWQQKVPSFGPDEKGIATRSAGGKVMNAIANDLPFLIGGSGDLNPSTKTALKDGGTFEPPQEGGEEIQGSEGKWWYGGANLNFGVREHAMGGIISGLAMHGGFLPYGATFLIFSDYMRPAIRLAALGGLRLIYVFTHDSVALGEDGPTHQPVEHIPSLRAIPNMTVIRPADANETAEAWKAALMHKEGPVSLILSRQNLPTIDRKKYAAASGLHKGAYVLAGDETEKPDIIIIATGSEVHICLQAYETLRSEGISARLVSMPCQEFFDSQPEEYRNKVLPPEVGERIAVEAAATQDWYKYAGPKYMGEGAVIGLDHFGASAPGKTNMREFGFTAEHIIETAKAILGKKAGALH